MTSRTAKICTATSVAALTLIICDWPNVKVPIVAVGGAELKEGL